MKKSYKLLSLVMVGMLSSFALVGCGSSNANNANKADSETETETEEKIVWKLGHLGNEDHVWNKTALKFSELVSEKTNGQIEVKVYPNEQLGSEVDNINMIQSGAADMVIAGESMQNWAPKAALIAVPYAFNDTASMREAIEGEIGEEIAAEIEEKVELIPLYYHARAPRNLTSKDPISTPTDLAGFKMRVPNVPLFVDAWKAAGASPQVMSFSEVFTGLQQGVIDGQENPVDLIYSAGFYEVQKYVNETEHVNGWVYVLVGKKQFESLSEDLQAAVLEASEEAQVFGDELFEAETQDFKEKLEEKGMVFNEVDKEAFREAMLPAIEASLDEEQLDLYQRILANQ
jgi:tripartite ATP-independent transporter DctP family solute receptor